MNAKDRDALLHTLNARFAKHMHRHKGIAWADVRARLVRAAGRL